jgi:Sec-independent protein translocase protein TatA
MDFFNVGTSELVFLVLLAILLVGPKRAVELVQQVRRLTIRLQREWAAVQQEVITEVQSLQQETLAAVGPSLQEDLRRMAEETKALEKEVLATAGPSLQEDLRRMAEGTKVLEKEVLATGGPVRPQSPGGAVSVPLPQPVGPGEDKAG